MKGRTSRDEITYSERGNLQGAQFYAVAGKVYELAKQANLGYNLPTSMPAAIPAEVHTGPSAIKMRSISTLTFGKRCCSS